MSTNRGMICQFASITRFGEKTRLVADHVVARAHAAHRLGGTAQQYRTGAQELGRQAERAEKLLFSQAVKTLRAAADEHEFIADALDIFEFKKDT